MQMLDADQAMDPNPVLEFLRSVRLITCRGLVGWLGAGVSAVG
jgi:hypothetical protein